MHGRRIWELLWSSLCSTRTRLRFTWIAARSNPAQSRAAVGRVWPLPLPYPEVHRSKGGRRGDASKVKLGVNYIVLCLNHMQNKGKHWRFSCPGNGTPLNRAQWDAVAVIEGHVVKWNGEEPVSAEDMGRAASKVESTEEIIALLEQGLAAKDRECGGKYGRPRSLGSLAHQFAVGGSPGEVIGVSNHVPMHLAKSVEADRLKFCGEPSFDAAPFLSPMLRDVFINPLDHAAAAEEDLQPPRVSVRCSGKERLRLLEKLDSSGRLRLMRPSDVRMRFRNGIFAVPKDGSRDRMVLDARPPNMLEDATCSWINSLASVSQLDHVFLRTDQEMRMFAEDLREFYHAFLISEQRTRRNALACEVRPEQVSHFKCFKEELRSEKFLVPCLGTMAMGDCQAVTMGQVSHLAVLLRTRALDLDDFIMLHCRPSRKDWIAGLMIDDLVLLERRVRFSAQAVDHEACPPSPCEKIIAEVRKKYEEVGLPRHSGKAVYNSLEGGFWGLQFDGERGEARTSYKRSIPLAFVLQRVASLGVSTVGLLEVLAGSLVAVFQTKRRFMSVLEEIYCAQRGRERKEIVSLSRELREELLLAAALIPLTSIDFRLEASPHLVASDASTTKEAAVCCAIGKEATEELHRHTLQKGLWNRLLNPLRAYRRETGDLDPWEELPDRSFEELYGMHPVWEEIVSSQQFRQLGTTVKANKRRHINIGEIRAAIRAEQEEGRLHPGRYYVHLQDSQVALACLLKGRSSSRAANHELLRSIPMHVSQRIRPFYGYVRSKKNPADDPTRNQAVRPPDRSPARWLTELQRGETQEFDDFITDQGVHPSQTRGTPEQDELWPDPPLNLDSGREVRRRRRLSGKLGKASCCEHAEVEVQRPRSAEDEDSVSAEAEDTEVEIQRPRFAEGEVSEAEITEAEKDQRLQGRRAELSTSGAETGGRGQAAGEPRMKGCVREKIDRSGRQKDAASRVTAQNTTVNDKEQRKSLEGASLSREVIQELLSFSRSHVFSESFDSLEAALASGPGLLDLFAGSRGLTKACCRGAPIWSLTFDISHSPSEDLLNVSLQKKLTKLVRAGAFFAMVAGPVCSSFSSAITPPTRTLLHPEGVPWASELQAHKNDQGNRMIPCPLGLGVCCLSRGLAFLGVLCLNGGCCGTHRC